MIILQGGGINPASFNMISLFLFVAILYFFFMRPQMKRQKEQDNFLKNIEKGDEVVTASGIIGKVNKIEENHFQIQIDQKTFLKVVKNAVSQEMTAAYNKP